MRKDDIIAIAGVILSLLLLSLVGCKTPQPIVTTETKEVVIEREVRDTIITTKPDSATIKALLECDSAGNVLIRELEEAQGKNLSLEMLLKQDKGKTTGATLEIDCKADSLQMVIDVQNEHIKELNDIINESVKEVKYIPEIVKWFAWVGAFFVVLYLVKGGLWVYRKFVLKV